MQKLNDPNWQKLFDDLLILARKNLRNLPKQEANEEDIACSAIGSYFRAVEQGRIQLPQDDNFSLWPLLSIIAVRKCADLAAYLKAQKRDISRITETEIDAVIGNGASPPSIAEQKEDRQRLLEALADDQLRKIAEWKMEGYTNKEIAEKLDIVERSVERGTSAIKKIWESYVAKKWADFVSP